MASALGFDFRRGRLDTSVHPFSSLIGPGDCRITTRFRADDFGSPHYPELVIATKRSLLKRDPDVIKRESEPLAHALIGAAVALVSWAGERRDEPSELQALRLMNFAWMGLGSLVRGELWIPPTEEESQ